MASALPSICSSQKHIPLISYKQSWEKFGIKRYENSEIYKLHAAKNGNEEMKFFLETIIEEQRDDSLDKCFEVKYKAIGPSKQLISKKEIK